jgi:hypothetical protein
MYLNKILNSLIDKYLELRKEILKNFDISKN